MQAEKLGIYFHKVLPHFCGHCLISSGCVGPSFSLSCKGCSSVGNAYCTATLPRRGFDIPIATTQDIAPKICDAKPILLHVKACVSDVAVKDTLYNRDNPGKAEAQYASALS